MQQIPNSPLSLPIHHILMKNKNKKQGKNLIKV